MNRPCRYCADLTDRRDERGDPECDRCHGPEDAARVVCLADLPPPRPLPPAGRACDLCGKPLAPRDGWMSADREGRWRFVCGTCPDGEYDIAMPRFLRSSASVVDWLAHLSEKYWFDPWAFLHFMRRLRESGLEALAAAVSRPTARRRAAP